MPPRLKALQHNPYAVGLLLAAVAEVLFAAWIDRPGKIMFDEVHYVPAALSLLSLDMPRNVEHPMLGKELIALGIALFGDNAWGWRLVPSLAGAATVAGSFAFLRLLTRDMRAAVVGALLVMLNQLVFVLARIAMLDVFLGLFLVWGMAAMLVGGARHPAAGALALGRSAAR
ncbi:MAG: phospholipid carrier-dependent glycosyltransferase [Sphingomonas sp.]